MTQTAIQILNSYANLLLVIATALYMALAAVRPGITGSLATGCAFLGAGGLLISVIEQSVHPEYRSFEYNLSFILSLVSAITVITYLIMEKWYGTRTAGAFVMPVVAICAIFEMLGGRSDSLTVSHGTLMLQRAAAQLYVLTSVAAFCAFLFAAGCGVLYLWRERYYRFMFGSRSIEPLEQTMGQSIALGFFVYTVAQILGIPFSGLTFIDNWNRYLHLLNLAAVWMFYSLYYLLQHYLRWHGRFMAWCSITGFCLYCVLLLPELRTGFRITY